jgi:aminoglycoside phosphotransferase (APT) family kinase protein
MQPDNTSSPNIYINENLVSQLVASQFSKWANLPIKPVEVSGWDNRTFRLGNDMSVRLPSEAWYVAQVEKEQYWLPKLAPFLPIQIPIPLALGYPDKNYPWHWSIYQWLEGKNASIENISNLHEFAISLAQFLVALYQIDSSGGPPPGEHNFFRGGALNVYDDETRSSIAALKNEINSDMATEVWETALDTKWNREPVWLHGDFASGNLLVNKGKLSAVIDFGCSGIGDPACDLTIAWTFLTGESRNAFIKTIALDGATWARARGWALWKALITLVEHIENVDNKSKHARYVINEVLNDHRYRNDTFKRL